MYTSCKTTPAVGLTNAERIIEVQKTKAEMFTSSVDWIAKGYAIEFLNKEAGKLVGSGAASVRFGILPADTRFTLSIDLKDGKARIAVQNIRIESTINGMVTRTPTDEGMMRKFMQQEGNRIFDSFAACITSETPI